MKEEYKTVKRLFEIYDKASNEVADCLIKSLEARRIGKTALANYLINKIYPKLQKRSYELFCKYTDACNKL
jgi:hypothetical protein